MKKIIPIFLVFLLLAGCKVKDYTPEIPETFEQNASVGSGDFSYDCKICRNKENVIVTVLSTSAKDMIMTYDGSRLAFNYESFSYDINGGNFEKNNVAIVVYEVFDYLNNANELNVRRIDSGFKYEGKVSYGDFILMQRDDNSFESLSFRGKDLNIKFQ